MTQPSEQDIEISLNDLSKCAQRFSQHGRQVTAESSTVSGHLGDGMSFGIFFPVGVAYQNACQKLGEAARTGGGKLVEVGETLDDVRRAYQLDEDNRVHLAQGKW